MEKISIKYLTKKSPLLSDKNKKSENNFWSLRGITFSVTEGEAIGLIGRNGSGKALLLKILAGLEEPTTGFISTKSHIYLASMTNSINFQLTGLENIKKQVDQAYDDEIEADHVVKAIIDFTEIGQWVYRPVSEYSTGMLSRLALSIALFNKPEVVLLDEVFASLERAFFEKVIRKIQDLKDHGVSFIITATTGLVLETLCERSMWLDFGEVKELGPTQIVMSKFQYQNDWYNGLTLPEKNKYLKEKGKYWVLRSKNILDDGTIIHIKGYDKYIDDIDQFTVSKYINSKTILMPNFTYNTRATLMPPDVLVNGSIAILIPKNKKLSIDKIDLSIYATDEFREYYAIVKNKSKFTINIDKNSIYYIGAVRCKNGRKTD